MIAGICRRYAIVDERGLRDAVELQPVDPSPMKRISETHRNAGEGHNGGTISGEGPTGGSMRGD